MQTFHAYKARGLITSLTNLADELEQAEMPEWHVIARAAACLERLLHGEQPADLSYVIADLKALNVTNPGSRQFGNFTFLIVTLAITVLDAIRLDLLDIQPKAERPKIQPRWLGIDMAKPGTETTVTFRGDCHA